MNRTAATRPARSPRSEAARAATTRRLLLDAAERLYAQHGIADVSNRQVAEAAGQANNSAVAYHIGTKTDLVLAVMRAHTQPMDRLRAAMLETAAGSPNLRDHLACLVRPLTRHLAELGVPSWYARFAAQVDADPTLRVQVLAETTATPVMGRALEAVRAHLPDQPAPVAMIRAEMTRHAIVHTCAEHERTLAQGAEPVLAWDEIGELLLDALVGLHTAPTRR